MFINDIISKLELSELNLRLCFIRKRGSNYDSYCPGLDPELQKKLIELIKDYITKFKDYEVLHFSPVGYKEQTIEKCNCSYIDSYNSVIESTKEENLKREPLDDNSINKLNFYCLELIYKEADEFKKIYFFRRVTRFKRLTSNGFFGQIKDNRFKKIDSNLLGIDGDVDIIVSNGEIVILNHISLERIFSLVDQYSDKAKTALAKIKVANRISSFERFEIDCLNDGRVTRILTKMLSEENRLDNCFENFENVVNAIEIFELDIDVDTSSRENRIIYENKEQLMDIIRLVRDSYYKSIINERTGIDDSN